MPTAVTFACAKQAGRIPVGKRPGRTRQRFAQQWRGSQQPAIITKGDPSATEPPRNT